MITINTNQTTFIFENKYDRNVVRLHSLTYNQMRNKVTFKMKMSRWIIVQCQKWSEYFHSLIELSLPISYNKWTFYYKSTFLLTKLFMSARQSWLNQIYLFEGFTWTCCQYYTSLAFCGLRHTCITNRNILLPRAFLATN